MSQVIEVRFINDATSEVLADEFTAVSTKNYSPTSHTSMHREAIELALKAWSGGVAILKDIQRDKEINGVRSGPAWKYGYDCTLAIGEGEDDRHLLAILFAEYREKSA